MDKKRRLLIVRLLLFIGTAISLFFVPWIIVRIFITPLPDTVQEQLNQAIHYDLDGIIVYVDKKGESPEFYAAGWKNRENKIPADPHALFKIASVDKLYHALAITKLVANNKLDLDKTLADYFPELKERIQYADKITLRMIVKHRSGIPSFTNTPNYWMHPAANKEEALELILDQAASFEPDTDYEYSNTNYLLLSNLIEKTIDTTKYEFFKKEIFEPLHLENTYLSINQINMDDLTSGYYVGVEQDLKFDNNGSMVASAEDVGIFLRALNEGTIFNEGEKEIYDSLYYYEHTGLIPGYQTIARYHPDIDAVIIQFVNTTNFTGYTWTVGEMVYDRVVKIVKNNH